MTISISIGICRFEDGGRTGMVEGDLSRCKKRRQDLHTNSASVLLSDRGCGRYRPRLLWCAGMVPRAMPCWSHCLNSSMTGAGMGWTSNLSWWPQSLIQYLAPGDGGCLGGQELQGMYPTLENNFPCVCQSRFYCAFVRSSRFRPTCL